MADHRPAMQPPVDKSNPYNSTASKRSNLTMQLSPHEFERSNSTISQRPIYHASPMFDSSRCNSDR